MKNRSLVLQAALTAVCAAVSSSAMATVTLSTSAASTPAVYASELVSDGVVLNTAATTVLNLIFSPTWGVAAGNHLYVRVDLTNGKFHDATMTLTSGHAGSVISLSAGGAVGDTFAIYDVSNPAGILLTDVLTLDPKSLTLTSAASDISAQVRFYTDASAASTGTDAIVGTTLSDKYVTQASTVSTVFTAASNTATVNSAFKTFAANTSTGTGAGVLIQLGKVLTTIGTTALKPSTSVAAVAADLATATNLVVTGVFDAGTVGMTAAADCTGASTALTLNTAKTTATATGFAGVSLVATKPYVCFTAGGTAAVAAQTATGVLTFTGQVTGATVAAASGTVGTILHDGTTMVSPLVQTPAGWFSRLVLTNASSLSAAYTVRALTVDGVATTLTGPAAGGTLLANATTVIDLPALITTSSNRASFVITVAAPQASVDGLYQIVNPTGGAVSNYVLSYK
jgi:hypothetical protein